MIDVQFDFQIFSYQRFGGISRYFVELINRISADPSFSVRLPQLTTDNQYFRAAFPESVLTSPGAMERIAGGLNFGAGLLTRRSASIVDFNERRSVAQLKRHDFDLFHPTYYNPYFVRHLGDRPFVLTVHDMIHEIYRDWFPSNDSVSMWKSELIPRAEAIIAVSQNTKRDILRYFDIPEDRIHVVYHGVSLDSMDASEFSPLLSETIGIKYLLFVGNREGYKNFDRMILGLAPLFRRDPDLLLICVGGGPFSAGEQALLKRQEMADRVRLIKADDVVLAELYRQALAFVFPSLYEGFGLPVLEAFACGCPGVLSNSSSLPEVGGDAAVYFDPEDPVSIGSAVESVIYDSEVRRNLHEKGSAQVKRFSWERTARATSRVYEWTLC